MRDFRKLDVWQCAHRLTVEVFRTTARYPSDQLYVLVSQTRRAALSVPANIVEGQSRTGPAEFARFLSISSGSVAELEYHLILARDLGYLSEGVYEGLQEKVVQVRKMLSGLLRKVRAARRQP